MLFSNSERQSPSNSPFGSGPPTPRDNTVANSTSAPDSPGFYTKGVVPLALGMAGSASPLQRMASFRSSRRSSQNSAGPPEPTLLHNSPLCMHTIEEIDEHLKNVGKTDAERTPLLNLDPTLSSTGIVLHALTASTGVHCRRTLLTATIQNASHHHLQFAWWIAASDSTFVMNSMMALANAVDESEAVSKMTNAIEVLRDYVEQQREFGKTCVFILEDCSTDIVVDFLSHHSPRWGAHVILLPQANHELDLDKLRPFAQSVSEIQPLKPHMEDFQISDGLPEEEVRLDHYRMRCEGLISNLHGGFVDETWLLRCTYGSKGGMYQLLLMRLAISAMENLGVDSYELHQKVKAYMTRDDRPCDLRAAVFRVYCDALMVSEEKAWMWALVALPRMFPAIIIPPTVLHHYLQSGLIVRHPVRGSTSREPILMLATPSWLMTAVVDSASEVELHDAFRVVLDRMESLNRTHAVAVQTARPQWSRASIEVTALNNRGDDVSVVTTAFLTSDQELARDTGDKAVWRIWAIDLIRYILKSARQLRLFFPRAAQLLVPKSTRKLKVVEVPALPESTRQWNDVLVDKYMRVVDRLVEEERSLEAASASEKILCILLHLSDHDQNNVLLLLGVAQMYVLISNMYVKSRMVGLAEKYVDRYTEIIKAVQGMRRDTPAMSAALLSSGNMRLELSAQERRRAQLVRESQILEGDPSDMQLRTSVKAEVAEKSYLHDAATEMSEAATFLKKAPKSMVGAQLSAAHETVALSMKASHRDREALAEAEVALDALLSDQRATEAERLSKKPKKNVMTTREEMAWIMANVGDFVEAIRTCRYGLANELLDRSLLLSHCVYIDDDEIAAKTAGSIALQEQKASSTKPQRYVFLHGSEMSETLVRNAFPAPIYFEHLRIHANMTEAVVAKHHGLDWMKNPVEYLIPAHVLLTTCDSEQHEATTLFRRLLETGIDPNACSPHDMRTLLHIALERRNMSAVQILVSHPMVDVEHVPPYILSATRTGLSTRATVERLPCTLAHPIAACRDPQLLLVMLLQGKTPHDTFWRNHVSICEALGLQEDADHLQSLFAYGMMCHREVPRILRNEPDKQGRTITSETLERIAEYCPGVKLVAALNDVDDEHVVHVLARRLVSNLGALDGSKELVNVVTNYIHREKVDCAVRIMDNFPVNLEMLFWEDAAHYQQMVGERHKKEQTEKERKLKLKLAEEAAEDEERPPASPRRLGGGPMTFKS